MTKKQRLKKNFQGPLDKLVHAQYRQFRNQALFNKSFFSEENLFTDYMETLIFSANI